MTLKKIAVSISVIFCASVLSATIIASTNAFNRIGVLEERVNNTIKNSDDAITRIDQNLTSIRDLIERLRK